MDIAGHYETHLESQKIISALKQAYPDGADKYQLAPIDQLHIGGIKASEKLLRNLKATDKVLEIGSGCGGLMRLIQEQGIAVTGLDISHGLNTLNKQLTSVSSALKSPQNSGNPNIITGDAHNLPFPDNSFTVVVMQHSLLNMPDILKVLSECERVLKPSGIVVLHEVFQGKKDIPMLFPVPWASSHEGSCLVTEINFINSLNESGFKTERIEDWTAEALNWRKKQQVKEANIEGMAPVVSPIMIFGHSFQTMANNLVENLSSGAIRVLEVVLRK